MTSRQAAWLALALIGVCVSVALPWRAGPASRALLKPVVILGVDGMDPGALRRGSFQLEGLTVEVLRQYGIEKPDAMKGTPVLR